MIKQVTIRSAAGELRTATVRLAVEGDDALRESVERVVSAALLGYRTADGDRAVHTVEYGVEPAPPPARDPDEEDVHL